jgi:E3 ubiquitin-protein ligase MARCH6
MLTLPLDMLSTENVVADILQGCFVVLCSLGAFISLVWLREQILSGGGPDWLQVGQDPPAPQQQPPRPPRPQPVNNQNNEQQQQQPVVEQPPARNNEPNEMPVGQFGGFQAMPVNPGPIGVIQPLHQLAVPRQPPPLVQQPPPVAEAGAANAAAADDNHWNPMDWDRAAEDLTWDRLLGLDGSLLFLEHVFWVISLNTLFILGNVFFFHQNST